MYILILFYDVYFDLSPCKSVILSHILLPCILGLFFFPFANARSLCSVDHSFVNWFILQVSANIVASCFAFQKEKKVYLDKHLMKIPRYVHSYHQSILLCFSCWYWWMILHFVAVQEFYRLGKEAHVPLTSCLIKWLYILSATMS